MISYNAPGSCLIEKIIDVLSFGVASVFFFEKIKNLVTLFDSFSIYSLITGML